MSPTDSAAARHRSRPLRLFLALLALAAFCGFLALGTWQVERRRWKLDLIERVDQRVHAAAVEAPGPARWPAISAATDEYRHVRLTGRYLRHHDSWVQASTELGRGYWLLTPLRGDDGSLTLINRGFVPSNTPAESSDTPDGPAPEPVTVTGLLRLSEPGGSLLQHNDPAARRWYSRDVQAIAQAQNLGPVAPYFIDADAAEPASGAQSQSSPTPGPVGGLTVIAFHNNHLVYAITWYALALMALAAAWLVVREERQPQRAAVPEGPDGTDGDPAHDRPE